MKTLAAILFWGFLAAYVLALGIWLIGTFGWFGQAQDPLSGIFLVVLGWPWNRLVDLAPEAFWPVLAAASPAVTAGLLRLLYANL